MTGRDLKATRRAGPGVGIEDLRDDPVASAGLGDNGVEGFFEVERRGAPDVAPAAGEDGGAGALVGAEEGDDAAQDAVREAADQIRLLLGVQSARFAVILGDDAIHGASDQGPIADRVGVPAVELRRL